eukprot:jgi/Ulvmu1/5987/UM026_0111.1
MPGWLRCVPAPAVCKGVPLSDHLSICSAPPSSVGSHAGNTKKSRQWDIDTMLFGDDDGPSHATAATRSLEHEAAPAGPDAVTSMPPASPAPLAMSRRKQAQMQESERKHRDKYAEEKEVDVGQLQSLEDAEQEGIANKVADAPKVHMTRHMHALHDLEGKGVQRVRQHLAEKFGPDIDFSLLLSCLLPEDQLEEKEEFWDENLLLTEIVSELETLKESEKVETTDY